MKHGIAAFLVGLALLAFAWFQTGDSKTDARRHVILASLISYPQAILLGLLQGVAELFPISSLGQSVILPSLLGWNIHQNDPYFVSFLVATHLATALVLLGFFWADWVRIVKGLGRSLRDREIAPDDTDAKLAWLLIVGTIPAGILGLTLDHKLRSVFASATSASFFLMLNGLMLYGAELLRRRAPVHETGDPDERIAKRVGWKEATGVGAAQAIALIPGFSRSGASMGGGLLSGTLEHRRGAVRLPARDADHRRGRGAQAAGPARQHGRRRSRAGARRLALLGGDRLSRRPLPDALLRDEPADAVRGLLSPGRARMLHLFRLLIPGIRSR